MPPSSKTGRKHLSRIYGRCFPGLSKPTCPRTVVWFRRCRVSPTAAHASLPQSSSQDQHVLCYRYPSFQNSKHSISPLHQVLSALALGRARLNTVLLLRFNPAVQREEEKSRNGQLAILNWRNKFPVQLCPSYFNNHSSIVKKMINRETRNSHTAGEVLPLGATSHHLQYFCIFLPLVHILIPIQSLWGCLFPSPPRSIEDLAKNPK